MESITTDQRAKSLYTLPPANALRREGRPVRPWREAHSLSPCPDGQRQRLRTRKPDSIARVLHPRSDDTRCCPADSSWACPPGSQRIGVYSYKVPARPEAKSLSPVQCCCQWFSRKGATMNIVDKVTGPGYCLRDRMLVCGRPSPIYSIGVATYTIR